MPIRKDLRHFYQGPAWRAVRRRILARAGNACEQCHKPNGEAVETITGKSLNDPVMYWRATSSTWRDWRDWLDRRAPAVVAAGIKAGLWQNRRVVKVVITIAHLNHVAGDDRDENLKALCQWCHLHYDQTHHSATRATRKDAKRPLLEQSTNAQP
jgi:sugar phosphate isomerase/epimerase